MEAGSEEAPKPGESNGGPSKPKRQMKTPFQLETLEKAYASMDTTCGSSFSCFVDRIKLELT